MTSVADAALARALAEEAAAELLALRSRRIAADDSDGRALRTAGDTTANALLLARLAERRPGDVVLSEEAPDPRARLAASRVWIVDPLDGTREFGEPGRSDWAVHVALWADGELTAGAVALPALGEVHATDSPPVRPEPRVTRGAPRIVVSRSRPPAFVAPLAAHLGAVVVPLGSAGAKAAAVWRGEADAYVHSGGLHEWDAAAPVVVARSAGLHASRMDGAPLAFNRPQPYLSDLLIATPELAGPILEWTARHHPEVILR